MKWLVHKNVATFSLGIIICLLLNTYPQKAEAILGVGDIVYDPANHVENTITAKAVSINTAKDAGLFGVLSLDGMAHAALNILIEQMLQSTIAWINSGFNGSPAFVENFEAFVLDVADRYMLAYIGGGNLQALCSPFKLDIQFALAAQYGAGRDGYQATCRVTEAIKNHEGFLDGDFIGGGGWNAWRDITLNPTLNAHGAYLEAQGGLMAGVSNARNQARFEINIGQGFLSKEECVDADGDGEEDDNCEIITPGQTIQGYLGDAIAAPIHRMTIADEIDELIGALINQLAGGVLDNLKGGGGGRQIDPDAYNRALADLEAQRQQTATQINQQIPNSPISAREQYIELLQDAMQLLLSCGDQLSHNQGRDLDNRYNTLRDELAEVVSNRKNVTETMVEAFQTTDLPEIQALVESMPDQAMCAI